MRANGAGCCGTGQAVGSLQALPCLPTAPARHCWGSTGPLVTLCSTLCWCFVPCEGQLREQRVTWLCVGAEHSLCPPHCPAVGTGWTRDTAGPQGGHCHCHGHCHGHCRVHDPCSPGRAWEGSAAPAQSWPGHLEPGALQGAVESLFSLKDLACPSQAELGWGCSTAALGQEPFSLC